VHFIFNLRKAEHVSHLYRILGLILMTEESASYIVNYFPYFSRVSILPAIFIFVLNFDISCASPLDLTFSSCYSFFQIIFLLPLFYGILSLPLSGSLGGFLQ